MKILLATILLFTTCLQTLHAQDLELHPKLQPLSFKLMGPFTRTKEGDILAIDAKATYLSKDNGKTWSEPRPIFALGTKMTVSNERAILTTQDGTIIVGFMNLDERKWTWKDELHDAPGAVLPTYVMRSTDSGKTWQNIQKMHDDWSGCVRDMIQTQEGRIIFTAMKMLHNPGRHTVLTYSSNDDGLTWAASNLIDLGGQGHHGGVTEPTLIELEDGRIWQLIRTNWGEFWSGYSNNGGRHWQTLQPSGIPASSAPGMLTRLDSGRLILLWNRTFPEGQDRWEMSGGDGLWSEVPVSNFREELSLAFSNDDGKTWTRPTVIASHKGKWLSYPYAFEPTPGQIWLTTMQGNVRASFREADFVSEEKIESKQP
ncbi:sialidase family protein [Thalassoglobus sp.]|uniref:sialidase family protein n=1 Tax=Thalassoglobus sp. TaxID=2795869 RepID=UPI003AA8719F